MAEEAEVDLQSFIAETLTQIALGVYGANEAVHAQHPSRMNTFGLTPGQERAKGQGVEFEVSLAVKRTAGGWGLKVVNVSFDRGKASEHEMASLVKFTVSVDRWVCGGDRLEQPPATQGK